MPPASRHGLAAVLIAKSRGRCTGQTGEAGTSVGYGGQGPLDCWFVLTVAYISSGRWPVRLNLQLLTVVILRLRSGPEAAAHRGPIVHAQLPQF